MYISRLPLLFAAFCWFLVCDHNHKPIQRPLSFVSSN
jgi:hypothetical protein